MLEKALWGGVILAFLIALVFFTHLVDAGVYIGQEKTDGFLDGGAVKIGREAGRGEREGGW